MSSLTPLKKSLLGALLGFILFGLFSLSITRLYYQLMHGKWFVNVYYAHVDDLSVGQDLAYTVCRTTRYANVRLNATRTFLMRQKDGRYEVMADYQLKPVVEQRDQPCQTVHIPAGKQPQLAGTWRLCTTADFYVEGYRKTVSYCTNDYRVDSTPGSIRDEIDSLQRRIDALEDVLLHMKGASSGGQAPAQGQAQTRKSTAAEPTATRSSIPQPLPEVPRPTPEPEHPPAPEAPQNNVNIPVVTPLLNSLGITT